MLSRRAILTALLAASPAATQAATAARPPLPEDAARPARGGARFGGAGRSHGRGGRHFTCDYRVRQKSNRF